MNIDMSKLPLVRTLALTALVAGVGCHCKSEPEDTSDTAADAPPLEPVVDVLVADVNADLRDDAVLVREDGSWWTQLAGSAGELSEAALWLEGAQGDAHHLADVDGDGRADAVWMTEGAVYVARSDETHFASEADPWLEGWGLDLLPTRLLLGALNEDEAADAMTFQDGDWYAALSSGAGFGTPSIWREDHMTKADDAWIANVLDDLDVPEDDCAEIIAFLRDDPDQDDGASNGRWYHLELSCGAVPRYLEDGTENPSWAQQPYRLDEQGADSLWRTIADMDVDGLGDAVWVDPDGVFYVARSLGLSFGTPDPLPTELELSDNHLFATGRLEGGFTRSLMVFDTHTEAWTIFSSMDDE